jgi:hypothetical protein
MRLTKRKMKQHLRGALTAEGGKLRAWTGIPVGIGITYAAGKVMPDFSDSISSQALYPLPYCAPAILLGVALLFFKKTRNMGYGVLGGTGASYLWAYAGNTMMAKIQELNPGVDWAQAKLAGARVQILG